MSGGGGANSRGEMMLTLVKKTNTVVKEGEFSTQ